MPTRAPRPAATNSASCSTSTPSTSVRSSTPRPCAASRWWPTPPTAWGASSSPRPSKACPVELEILFGELDGTFPNHPADPIQEENLADLKKAVLASKADIGLAFDGDADRVFLVDEQARPVSGSLTTALVARAMLEKHPGATVLYNLICSKIVPETIEKYGGTAVRTRVGHSFIKQVMVDTGAVFGGEHSGHYYFMDNYRADSGLIAAMIVLEELSAAGVPLSELLAPYRKYADSGEINTEVDDPATAVESLAKHFAAQGLVCDRTDGLTVDFDDWWFNVRPSNTEPLLRLNVEAASPGECDRHIAELLDLVAEVPGGAPRIDTEPIPARAQRHDDTSHTTDTRLKLGARRPMALDPLLLEVLACPEDKGPLLYFEDEDRLYNPRLHRSYEVRDGIPVMLVDEATAVDDAEHERLMAKAKETGRPAAR